eukprot:5158066-Ditylum_brightwellii.AAC.1
MRSAHLLGREEVGAPLEEENSKWHHSLSQAKHIMHNILTNQAALVAFLHKIGFKDDMELGTKYGAQLGIIYVL